MKDKFFLDTNILIYSFDPNEKKKRNISQKLIQKAIKEQSGCLSWQVVQEFLNVVTSKFKKPLSQQNCKQYLDDVLLPLCEIYPSKNVYHYALEVMNRWKFSLYDSLIISAATKSDCNLLYSEDLQHNQIIGPLKVQNPFSI